MTTGLLSTPVGGEAAAEQVTPHAVAPHPSATRNRGRGRSRLLVASIALVTLGMSSLVASTVAPDAVDRVTGVVKVAVQEQLRQVFAPDALPELRLGGEGGLVQLDECDGTFTEMVSYRRDGVPPLFAAHNNCGGDIILGWEIGQRVTVEGSDVVYEVVEERHTPKWSDLDALVGMSGEFMVQTCFYGENRMRFLALARVDPQPDQ
ncbi:hypothetical protein [uncultured Microbacterium sp.]|uniref:hypothetical protein n=1 Tax=uncultured Microbacterium sp. TaxID=191216 RepID=UPI0028D2DBB6|nr:hypothetical protein [uncultured Microbacterium sp.]